MPRTVHPPEWPDKVMFAALLVIISGALGALFALLRMWELSVDEELSRHIEITPAWLSFALCVAMIVLGLYGVHRQAASWVWAGIAAGIVSVGMLGLVPVLCLAAVLFLRRSRTEGETPDRSKWHPSLWPDKALAASLLLFVGGMVSLLQGIVLFRNELQLPGDLNDLTPALSIACVVAGLWSLFASFEIYRLRRPWTGYVAIALNVLSLGFVVVGPALALAALVLMVRAGAEKEFEGAPRPA